MIYRRLQDAKQRTGDAGFSRGRTRIWYARPESARDYRMGYDWLRQQGIPTPDPKTIEQTHALLGSIRQSDPERIFSMLQAEYWSPGGEARQLIVDRDLGHTSMSMGDIVQLPSGELIMVDQVGFRSIYKPRGKNPFVEKHKPVESVMVGMGEPNVYKYGDWIIEVTSWPKDDPEEWLARSLEKIKGLKQPHHRLSTFSTVGPHEVIRAAKIEIDAESLDEEAGIFWEWLTQFVQELRPIAIVDRATVARRIELARRDLRGAPAQMRLELKPAFDWFYAQPIQYRLGFIDRAIEFDMLKRGPQKRSLSRSGSPRPPNPSKPVVNTLKRRLTR